MGSFFSQERLCVDFRGVDGGLRPQALGVCAVTPVLQEPLGAGGSHLWWATAITPRATSASHFSGSSFYGAECGFSP